VILTYDKRQHKALTIFGTAHFLTFRAQRHLAEKVLLNINDNVLGHPAIVEIEGFDDN